MRGRTVEVEVQLLHVLAMVALRIREPEEPLLQDRILAIPQRERHAPAQRVVAESGNAVFAPTLRAAARMVVRKVVPGCAVRTVVLAYGAPLALAEVRSPALPV